jgi:hypothetical protein
MIDKEWDAKVLALREKLLKVVEETTDDAGMVVIALLSSTAVAIGSAYGQEAYDKFQALRKQFFDSLLKAVNDNPPRKVQ